MPDKCTFFDGRVPDPDFLADLREFLDGQADAEYLPGVTVPIPNAAMRLLQRLNELFPEEN